MQEENKGKENNTTGQMEQSNNASRKCYTCGATMWKNRNNYHCSKCGRRFFIK